MDTITKFIYQVNIKRFNFDHRFYFAHMLSGRTTIPGLAGHFHGMLSNENTVAGEVAPFSKVVESFLDSELKKVIFI
jgi:hypothetical protein